MAIEIFGIRIYLEDKDDPVTENTDIGLYNVASDNSQFRWLQNDVSGVSNWKSGILVEGGIGKYSKKIDITLGGNVSTLGGVTVKINNTDQIYNTIKTIPIYLTGKRIEIVYFNDTVQEVQWRGIINGVNWTRNTYNLSCSPSTYKRKTNIINEINIDGSGKKTVKPATFGEWRDNYALMNKTVDISNVMKASEIDTEILGYTTSEHTPDANTFPISDKGDSPTLNYNVSTLANSRSYTGTPSSSISMTDYYLKVVEDENDNDDSFRRISEVTDYSQGISATLSTYFNDDLSSDSVTWTGTWVQVHKIDKQFSLDEWPCAGFVDSSGTLISSTTNFDLSVYSSNPTVNGTDSSKTVQVENRDDNYIKIPGHTGEIIHNDTDNNTLKLSLSHFKEDSDKINDYIILPVTDVEAFTRPDLSSIYPDSNPIAGSDMTYFDDGVYKYNVTPDPLFTLKDYDASMVTDKDLETFWRFRTDTFSKQYQSTIAHVIQFKFPEVEDNVDLSKCYLLAAIRTSSLDLGGNSRTFTTHGDFVIKRNWGSAYDVINGLTDDVFKKTESGSDNSYIEIDNVPSFYANRAGSDNIEFYKDSTGQTLNGITNTEITQITSLNDYRLYSDGYFIIGHNTLADPLAGHVQYDTYFKQLAIIIPRKLSIKNKIFIRSKGRRYNDTWENRKTSDDMIDNPIDMLEHTCRLQNWSDYDSDLPLGGWGKGYSTGAQIKRGTLSIPYTSSAGSFSNGESITTSGGAQATLIYDDNPDLITFDVSGAISDGDHITGSTSGATATIDGSPENISDGSFDNNSLSELKSLQPSRQIKSTAQGWTDKIKKSLCKDFFLINYVDSDGRECVDELRKKALSVTLSLVTLADIRQAGGMISIKEPNIKDVYVEPYIKYNFDQGSQKYEDIIAVKNASADVYNAGAPATSGYIEDSSGRLDSTSAENYWNICHSLWSKFGVINEPSRDLSELKWSGGIEQSAQDIAENKLARWIEWQGNREISFSIHFSHLSNGIYARKWHEGQHFLLELPHETNNEQLECITTDITVSPNAPYNIDIKAILLDDSDIVEDFNIQDVMYTQSEGADNDWEDTMDESEPEIQDTM